MKRQDDCYDLAKSLGTEMELSRQRDQRFVDVPAPAGKMWKCDGIHVLCACYFTWEDDGIKQGVWDDLYSRMADGLEDDEE